MSRTSIYVRYLEFIGTFTFLFIKCIRANLFPCHRDRPQMVRVTKIPSEFLVSRMRESMMRQFVEQGVDVGLDANSAANVGSQEDVATVEKLNKMQILADCKTKSVLSTPQKKCGITSLMR